MSATTPQPTPLTTALPMKQMFGKIEQCIRGAGMGLRVLLERHRLPGQRRLVDEEILCRGQPNVRWDHVAGRQQYDVAGRQLLDRDFVMLFRRLPAGARSR